MNATWGEHQPAYYVATHTERKELLVAVRGTWEVGGDSPALHTLCATALPQTGGKHYAAFRVAQGGVSGQRSHALKASWSKLSAFWLHAVQVGPG